MRVLVTGSRGFVGPWLIAHLTELGDEVLELPGTTDVTDLDDVRSSVMAVEPDAICHLAAQSSVGQFLAGPQRDTRR